MEFIIDVIRSHIRYPINSINYCMMPVISTFIVNCSPLRQFLLIVIIDGLTIICRQSNSHFNNSYKIDVVITISIEKSQHLSKMTDIYEYLFFLYSCFYAVSPRDNIYVKNGNLSNAQTGKCFLKCEVLWPLP